MSEQMHGGDGRWIHLFPTPYRTYRVRLQDRGTLAQSPVGAQPRASMLVEVRNRGGDFRELFKWVRGGWVGGLTCGGTNVHARKSTQGGLTVSRK